MLRVLSDEQAFCIMNKNFDELQSKDVIDLCYLGERYPALVFSVYRTIRCFDVIPLTLPNIETMVFDGNWDTQWMMNVIVPVMLPNVAEQERPMWNKMSRNEKTSIHLKALLQKQCRKS